MEDRFGCHEEMMADMMVMMQEMHANSSIAGPSQPTASSTCPTQPPESPTDPQPSNDDEMGGFRFGVIFLKQL
ncbi:UNVERIFIED_CONTAM: hypothetical protein Sradi_0894000 [Sesamum radiatum]|uniref:Uncharacterized protein n=1 Tax=Sesamum radiatum TaxID=300843 RepID=A0AAW2V332_SESRA